jgi:hypothetical protein
MRSTAPDYLLLSHQNSSFNPNWIVRGHCDGIVLRLGTRRSHRRDPPTERAYRLQRFSNSGTYRCTQRRIVVWANSIPRSPIISTRSLELSLKERYHLTHSTMTSWSKCRPLNSSVPVAVILDIMPVRAQARDFAPEPFLE